MGFIGLFYDMKISVITVCFNCSSEIEETLLSVLNQSAYKSIEYIVIDGGSTDGTFDIIKKYSDEIDIFISESDCGVYDAMNKAIKLATGDYLIFMNAGDCFFDNKVCDIVYSFINNDNASASIYYGDVVRKKSNQTKLLLAEQLSLLRYRMPFSHQSCFIYRDIMRKNNFDITYKIAADFNFFHYAYVMRLPFKYINSTISIFEAENGISSTHYLLSIREVSKIICTFKTNTWIFDLLVNNIRGYLIYLLIQFRNFSKQQ